MVLKKQQEIIEFISEISFIRKICNVKYNNILLKYFKEVREGKAS